MPPKIARRRVGGGGWDIRPGTDLTAVHDNPTGRVVGTIAMCTRDRISATTAMSWMLTDYSFLEQGDTVSRQIVIGHVLTQQRNECVQRMEGDWILFVDDDMVWQPNALRILIEGQRKYDFDIVGGLCFQRGAPHQPTLYYRDGPDGNYNFLEDWDDGMAIEVDATGMAFTLIHRRVFDAILGEPMPSYEQRQSMPPPPFFRWTGEYGEDLQFCQDAKAAGARIFVDTEVKIGHIGEIVITEDTFRRELAFRSEEAWKARQNQNDRMKMPTVSPLEAMARVART